MDYLALKKQCENWIREGQSKRCATQLKKIKFAKIPHQHLATFCSFARRVDAVDLGLRALRPFIRPKTAASRRASAAETIEYAKGLLREGAFAEAKTLLADRRVATDPDAILARAFACMYQWDYESALSFLETYIKTPQLSEYALLTAKVNRLACLEFVGSAKFLTEFEDLRPSLSVKQYSLLMANALEALAQYLIAHEKWSEADRTLKDAKLLLVDNMNRSTHFVEKWQRILKALREKSIDDLEGFRAEAIVAQEWETLRMLDFYQAQLDPDSRWAYKVYYGTPYPSLRKKLEALRSFPEEFLFGTGDVSFDSWFPGHQEGDLAHRTLVLCLRDFYRPLPAGEIFASLHDDEYFDIDTLHIRARKMMSRTRHLIRESAAPLKLLHSPAGYSVKLDANSLLICRKVQLPLEKFNFFFKRYLARPKVSETTSGWAKIMDVSEGAASKFLNRAAAAGAVHKFKSGKNVMFATHSETGQKISPSVGSV